MSEFEDDDDPNAPSPTQVALKRVETAIRKRADCELILHLDGICMIADPKQRAIELKALTQRLAEK